jgi:short subunit dehydrogenase-like uncharacterized protein
LSSHKKAFAVARAQSARGRAHSKTLARWPDASYRAKRPGVRRSSAAFSWLPSGHCSATSKPHSAALISHPFTAVVNFPCFCHFWLG